MTVVLFFNYKLQSKCGKEDGSHEIQTKNFVHFCLLLYPIEILEDEKTDSQIFRD